MNGFFGKLNSIKTSEYLSCGTDQDENGNAYCYLQTAHEHEEETELLATKSMFLVIVFGKMLCAFFSKRLVRW